MKYTILGPSYIAFAALLWAFDGVLRRSLFELPPISIVFYEHLIGFIIIAPFALYKMKTYRPTRREVSAITWVAVVSGLLGTLWFTTALTKVNFIAFSVVFLLQKLQPIFAIATARILLKEKITKQYVKWAIVALVAAYFVTFKNGFVNFETGGESVMAALFALGAALAWGSSTAFSRYALLKQSGTVITGIRFAITTLAAFFLMLVLTSTSEVPTPDQGQLGMLVVIALTTGMFAIWIYYQGLRWTQAKIATVLELIFPVVAIGIDVFLYKTILAPSQYAAAAVLLYAVYQVSRLNRKTPMRFAGKIIHGAGKGKGLGYPTLNFVIPKHFPFKQGVYAGRVYVGDTMYRAAMHYGPAPVFKRNEVSLEAHALDTKFQGDPSDASFELVRKLRDITFFETEEDLSRQIAKDVEQTRSIIDRE